MNCSIFVPQILHEKVDVCDGTLYCAKDNMFVCRCGKARIPFFGKEESTPIVLDFVSMLKK